MESFLYSENYEAFIEKVLDYYDNTSKYQSPPKANIVLEIQSHDIVYATQQLLKLLYKQGIMFPNRINLKKKRLRIEPESLLLLNFSSLVLTK